MAIQYYMRGYNIGTPGAVGYVDWVVNDTPDATATYVPAPYNPANITNITVNKTVTSKVDNFLKPFESLTAIGEDGYDGYFFHLNSYDWLHATPPGPPIPVPSYLTGLSVVRGTSDGIIPRDYATLFWAENAFKWLFAYNTAGDGYTIGAALPVGMGNLSIDGYFEVGTNPALSGIIRIPNNQFIVSRDATNTGDGYLIGQDNLNRVRLGSPPGNQIYIPGDLRVDGYIRDGGNSSLSGFVRNSNATPIVTFRNALNTSDILALSSTSGNLIIFGDAINFGTRFNTADGYEHILQVNSSNLLRIGNIGGATYANFENDVLSPTISQLARSVGNGQNLTIQSQNTTSLPDAGGNLILRTGSSLNIFPPSPFFSDGYFRHGRILFEAGNITDRIGEFGVDGYGSYFSSGGNITLPAAIDGYFRVPNNTWALSAARNPATAPTASIHLIGTNSTNQILIGDVGDTTYIPGTLVIGTFNSSTVLQVEDRLIHTNFNIAVAGPPVSPPTLITGLTIHRGDDGALNYNDEAGWIWVDGVNLDASDGYWKAASVLDGDDLTLSTSLNMMGRSLSITNSPTPAAGTLPIVGGLRTLNNSTAVSSRNAAATQDLLLIGTDASDHIVMGSAASPFNTGFIFNTTTSSVYDFRINSISKLVLDATSLSWAAAVVNPSFTQLDNASPAVTANTLTVRAQNAVGAGSNGGSLDLRSGTGTGSPGTINCRIGSSSVPQFSVQNTFSVFQDQTSERFRITPGATTTLQYHTSITSAVFNQGNNTTNSATGAPLTIQAQNATGTISTGGNLILSSGTGTSTDGTVSLRVGSTTKFAINSTTASITTSTFRINDNTGAESFRFSPASAGSTNLQFASTVLTPNLIQADKITDSATGFPLLIRAQNATGTTSTGGNLVLTSGTGTLLDGYVRLQTGGTTVASIEPNKLVFNKGRRRNINTVTTTITIPDGYDYIAVDASTVYTITLPLSPNVGDTYEFKDVNGTSATNNITIAGNGKNIDGTSTIVISANFTSLIVTYTGTQWSIS